MKPQPPSRSRSAGSVGPGPRSRSVTGRESRREEVGEQLADALVLVVMDPVRGVGQALDALEARHIVVIGLGQVIAEVAIPLSPDDQGRRVDRAQRSLCALR